MTETLVEYGQGILENELKGQAISLKESAQSISVTDEKSYLFAGQFAKDIKECKNKILNYFKPLKEAAHKAHKAITQREADEVKPLDEADDIVRKEISNYLNEQERIRQEAQRKAEAEAAEVARIEQEKILKQAVKAEEKGNVEKAESLIEKAENVYVPPVIVPFTIQKTTKLQTGGGITRKTEIEVVITDELLFLKAITEKKAPLAAIEFKLGVVKSWVKNMKVKNGEIPGLLIKETSGVSIR